MASSVINRGLKSKSTTVLVPTINAGMSATCIVPWGITTTPSIIQILDHLNGSAILVTNYWVDSSLQLIVQIYSQLGRAEANAIFNIIY